MGTLTHTNSAGASPPRQIAEARDGSPVLRIAETDVDIMGADPAGELAAAPSGHMPAGGVRSADAPGAEGISASSVGHRSQPSIHPHHY